MLAGNLNKRGVILNPVHPLFAVLLMLEAFLTSYLLVRRFGVLVQPGQFASIDGLRGYLAFAVFICHASAWYFYLRTGHWDVPPSNLYTNLGQGSVTVFFMITGFLFSSKLVNSKEKKIDWLKLFISRILRIAPLYYFVMFLLFLTVACLSKWELHEAFVDLLKHTLIWFDFTAFGMPNLNSINHTFTIVAGVTWSLPYEWFFYFSLPLMAIFFGNIPKISWIAIGIVNLIFALYWHPQIRQILPFVAGMITSLLVKNQLFCILIKNKIFSIVILGLFFISFYSFSSSYNINSLILLFIGFILIAGGNTIFGLLTNKTSRFLGEISYSIYLLHGILLFISFNLVFTTTQSRQLNPQNHWFIAAVITPILIVVSFFTYRTIEHPMLQKTAFFTQWFRTLLYWRLLSKRQALLNDNKQDTDP